MPQFVFTSIVLVTLFLNTALSAAADQFYPQILAPAGGTIRIYASPGQGYHGTITFSSSNIPSGTAANVHGYLRALGGLGTPPAAATTLYSIVIGLDPKFTTLFSTSAASTVTLGFPQSVDLSKPINMYETEYDSSTPPSPTTWQGPYIGTVSGSVLTFSLPAFAFPGTNVVVLAVTQ